MKQRNNNRFKVTAGIILLMLALGISFPAGSAALAFNGPASGQAAGSGSGALGIGSNNDISVGTSTTQAGTKLLVVASSTADTSSFSFKVLDSSQNPLLIIRNDGSVGIGTATLGTGLLDVGGLIYSSQGFTGSLNAANVSAGTFGDNTGGGVFYFPAALGFAAGSPGLVLDGATGVGAATSKYIGGAGGAFGGVGSMVLNVPAGQGFEFAQNNLDKVVINPSGDVGIGTASPTAALTIAASDANSAQSNAVVSSLSFNNPGYLTGNGPYASFFGYQNANNTSGGGSYAAAVGIDAAYNGTSWSRWNGYIQPEALLIGGGTGASANYMGFHFLTSDGLNTNGTPGTYTPYEAMTIQDNGNVGIGTTNPGEPLAVQGTDSGTLAGAGSFLQVINASGAADTRAGIKFTADTAIGSGLSFIYSKLLNATNGASSLNFATYNGSSWNDPNLTIDSSGNVGIGTTNPTAGTLQVTAAPAVVAIQTSNNGDNPELTFNGAGGSVSDELVSYTGNSNLFLGANNNSNAFYGLTVAGGASAGNVGIGTSTPATLLTVAGNANITGNLTVGGTFAGGALTGTLNAGNVSAGTFGNNTGGGNYAFSGALTVPTYLYDSAAANSGGYWLNSYSEYGYLQNSGSNIWSLGWSGTLNGSQNNVLSWNASGNVGINTTPVGGSQLTVSSAGNTQLSLTSTGAGTNNYAFYLNQFGRVSLYDMVAGKDRFAVSSNGDTWLVPNGGNVGIGTTGPYSALTVDGASGNPTLVHQTPAIASFQPGSVGTDLVIGGSASSPYDIWLQNRHIALDGDSYPISLNPLGGNVGIGTTNPLSALDVNGSLRLDNGTSQSNYFATVSSRYDSSHPFSLSVENNTGGTAQEVFGVYSPGGGGYTNAVLGLNGNVGIGTSTPATLLTVAGNANITGNLTVGGTFAGGALTGTLNAGNVSAGTFGNNTGGGNYAFPGVITIASGINRPDGAGLAILPGNGTNTFYADTENFNNAIGNTTLMTINSSGNVGIGTTNPAELNSDARLALNSGLNTYLTINAPYNEQTSLTFGDQTDGQDMIIYRPANTQDLRINSNGTGGVGDVVTFAHNGNVGIGTLAPSSLFSVGSNSPFQVNTTGQVTVATTNGGAMFTGHESGSGYANTIGVYQAITDNPNGASNYYYQGVTSGTINFSVRADGQGYFAGDVSIGTTNSSAQLEISGSATPAIYIASTNYPTSYQTELGVQSTAEGVLELGNNGENDIRFGNYAAGGLGDIYVNNTAAYNAASNGTLAMSFAANGNVTIPVGLSVGNGSTGSLAIGSTGWYDDGSYFSPSGSRPVYIRGNVATTYIYSPNIYLGDGSSANGLYLRNENVYANNFTFENSGQIVVGSGSGANLNIDSNQIWALDNGSPSTLYLQYNANANTIINSNGGDVGIGTLSPSSLLTVGGNLTLTPSNPTLYTGGSYLTIPYGLYVSGGTTYIGGTLEARNAIANDVASYLQLSGGTSGYTDVVGKLGINTTAPNEALTVNGHIGTSGSGPTAGYGCGGGSVSGSDTAGIITMGGGALYYCPITFGTSFSAAPSCTITPFSNGYLYPLGGGPAAYEGFWFAYLGTSGFEIETESSANGGDGLANMEFSYICIGT